MRHRLIGSCFLVVSLARLILTSEPLTAQTPANAELRARIDAIVTAAMGPTGAPGISIAVVRGSDTIALKGYGHADVENDVRVTDRSVFRIGSVTKQFTSAAVMRLVEEGRVRLDARLSEYLPGYAGPGRRVTIHQLLNHTSGIPSYTGLGERFWTRSRLDLTDDQMLELFAGDSLEFEPGSRWAYNNSGYYLLGMLIEKVTGESYAEHLNRTQFGPLGLSQTLYCDEAPIVPHRAEGYDLDDGRIVNAAPLSMRLPGAAGALCSTPRDLVRWTRALAGGHVVSADSYGRMTTPTSLTTGDMRDYGYGLIFGRVGDHEFVGHGGGINGFNSYASHLPALDVTIVVLANGPTNAAAVHERITRAVLGLPQPVEGPAAEDVPIAVDELARYTGTYDLSPTVPIQVRVFVSDGRLMGQGTGQSAFPLRFVGDHTFEAPEGMDIRMVFTVEAERATSFTLHQAGAAIAARRIE